MLVRAIHAGQREHYQLSPPATCPVVIQRRYVVRGPGELGGSLSAIERRTFIHGSVQVESEISKSCSWVPRGVESPSVDGCRESDIARARFSGKTMTMGSRGAWRLFPSAIERRTFIHGSVQVESEISKSCSWVPRGGETPCGRWVQGKRTRPHVVQRQDAGHGASGSLEAP